MKQVFAPSIEDIIFHVFPSRCLLPPDHGIGNRQPKAVLQFRPDKRIVAILENNHSHIWIMPGEDRAIARPVIALGESERQAAFLATPKSHALLPFPRTRSLSLLGLSFYC